MAARVPIPKLLGIGRRYLTPPLKRTLLTDGSTQSDRPINRISGSLGRVVTQKFGSPIAHPPPTKKRKAGPVQPVPPRTVVDCVGQRGPQAAFVFTAKPAKAPRVAGRKSKPTVEDVRRQSDPPGQSLAKPQVSDVRSTPAVKEITEVTSNMHEQSVPPYLLLREERKAFFRYRPGLLDNRRGGARREKQSRVSTGGIGYLRPGLISLSGVLVLGVLTLDYRINVNSSNRKRVNSRKSGAGFQG